MDSNLKNIIYMVGMVLLICLLTPAYIYSSYLSPASVKKSMVITNIPSGSSSQKIGSILEKNGIIRSGKWFALYARLTGKAGSMKAGEYELNSALPAPSIISKLINGKTKLWMVTIPEGLTIKETADVIAAAGFSDEPSIIAAAHNKQLLKKFGIDGSSGEGYLFPDTYSFPRGVTGRAIVAKLYATFAKKVSALKNSYQASSPLSFKQIITLASIIEKETGNVEEYGIVSAVYNNRLKRGMLLQADPTVIYGLPNFDGNIRKKDLSYDSPYNTYVYRGLPPGPIANPGLGAIKGAYNPNAVSYLYFVAMKKDGRHYFSKNLVEHNAAVTKYQLRR